MGLRRRRRFGSWALLAVLCLFVASCASEDDGGEEGGSGSGRGTEQKDGPATCEGKPGDEPSAEPVGGGEADGAGRRVGMVLDIGSVDDKSFNQAANEGLQAAARDFGVEVQYLEPNEDGSNRGELLADMAQQGYELIFGVGFAFAESMEQVAADNPDTRFAIIDDASFEADNVTSLTFAEEQGSYLVGVAAALKSGTGRLGFVGGVETPLIQKFEAGYIAGAESVDEDIEVEVQYISQPPDFNGFRDPASMKTIAEGMYADDVDVIYHAAGGSGTGLFPVAQAEDRLAIGVDADQYQQVEEAQQPCILTSMLKRVDVAVYETIERFLNDELEAGNTTFTLEDEGIDYALDGGQLDDIEQDLEEVKQGIIDGDIEVPTEP